MENKDDLNTTWLTTDLSNTGTCRASCNLKNLDHTTSFFSEWEGRYYEVK